MRQVTNQWPGIGSGDFDSSRRALRVDEIRRIFVDTALGPMGRFGGLAERNYNVGKWAGLHIE